MSPLVAPSSKHPRLFGTIYKQGNSSVVSLLQVVERAAKYCESRIFVYRPITSTLGTNGVLHVIGWMMDGPSEVV